jgi:N-acetylglutamate synthase-like GNAT family acetyltransferase
MTRPTTCRTAKTTQAARIHALISASLADGHLLPRTLPEIQTHAERFVVAMQGAKVAGCAELAPLSPHVAEVRSLTVDGSARGRGVGSLLVEEVRRRARREGFDTLCAFTHAPGYFIQRGFSIVPHLWLPEKIFTDCTGCPRFRHCGQYAMMLSLDSTVDVEPSDSARIIRCA